MPKDNPSNTVLHMNRSIMSENDSAIIEKRALQDLVETLNSNGIKCHAAISKRDNLLVTQYYARVGSNIIPIGHPHKKKLRKMSEVREYTLKYCLINCPEEYHYSIMAFCDADAAEAAKAYCTHRNISQSVLVDVEDNFALEF